MMTSFFKILILIFTVLFFSSCAKTNSAFEYSNGAKTLLLKKDNANTLALTFTNPKIQNHYSFCIDESYTLLDRNIKYGNIFIELIELDFFCNWNGLASGFFESNIISELKLDSLEVVEDLDFKSYNFKTYRVNSDSYLNMIYIYGINYDKFILDYNGNLYDDLLRRFNPNYKNKYLSKKRFNIIYNDSLVRKNIVNHYFYKEREEIDLKMK